MFSKILIANRGEIACRIIRTARKMGIRTVAVYSEADRNSLHVSLADEAFAIGPAPARDSYLDAAKIIAVARESGAEAIHPGYGFLSENAVFSEACAAANLVFIGPPASAIRAMGGKSEAKALMAQAGVPLIPGYHGEDQSLQTLSAEAAKTGYPVLIKASAGGGGKGIRIVERPEDLETELAGAKREAIAAFGDDHMLIEKYLIGPRHVEVQIFADHHGNCVSLFERDCSIQRRHQKIIEEAPAPGLPDHLRKRMSDAAVTAAKAISYSGAGTVEFLLDAQGNFYFMEMNTRLQVEHPVTEFITGLDLVEWQLRVAAGERLPEAWNNLQIDGHAIEARICAEDPTHDFMPSIGRITHLLMPEQGPDVRIDSGIRSGDAITIHYDPMIAKLIVRGKDRASAVRRLQAALDQVAITGVASNTTLLARISATPDFIDARLDTGFIARNEAALFGEPVIDQTVVAIAAEGLLLERKNRTGQHINPHSPWANINNFRLNGPARESLCFSISHQDVEVAITYRKHSPLFEIGGVELAVEGERDGHGRLRVTIGDARYTAAFLPDGDAFVLFVRGEHYRIRLPDPFGSGVPEAASGGLVAPVPGIICAVFTANGAYVDAGTALVVIEAMKMEHTIRAPASGTIRSVHYAEGAMVDAGAVLIEFEPEEKQ